MSRVDAMTLTLDATRPQQSQITMLCSSSDVQYCTLTVTCGDNLTNVLQDMRSAHSAFSNLRVDAIDKPVILRICRMALGCALLFSWSASTSNAKRIKHELKKTLLSVERFITELLESTTTACPASSSDT
jgi:hypothetical protein